MQQQQDSVSAMISADQLIEVAKLQPERLTSLNNQTSKWKPLQQKLLEMYLECVHKQPSNKKVKYTSNLLAQLIRKEPMNTLVVNLYPGNEGYSLLLRGRNGIDSETIRLPYEETELLEYIDAEKLPPLLVDLFDKAQASLFHCGCVVAEVRDYRRSTNNLYDTHYVLLQPSMHTLLCDINSMTSDNQLWTTEDKLLLESQLLLQTSEPLCLDPSTAVFHTLARLNYDKHKLNTPSLQRCARRYSQAAINRQRKLSLCLAPKHLRLHDFVRNRKNKTKSAVNLRLPSVSCVDTWKRPEVQLTVPENIDVQKYAKPLDRPQLTGDNSPVTVEEYTFETERRDGRINMSRLVIMQRMSDELYLGTLYVDRDFKDTDSRGNACRFVLGTRAHVDKYVRQFREIFTEEGRRQVKITHQVPGRQPVVTYTQVSNSLSLNSNTTAAVTSANAVTGLVAQAQNASATGQLNIAATDAKLANPLRLAVSINSSQASGSVLPGLTSPPGASPGFASAAALRLSLQQQQQQQQQQQLNRQKSTSNSGPLLSPTGINLPTYNLVASQQHAIGLQPSSMMPSVAPSQAHGESANLTELLMDVANNSGGPVIWTSQASSSSMHIGSLSSVTPPNVNIGNINTLPPNVNIQSLNRLQVSAMHQTGLQGTSGQQRSFVAMVTSPAAFGASPPQTPLMSSPPAVLPQSSGMFMTHNQFSVPPGSVRGLSRASASPTDIRVLSRPLSTTVPGMTRPLHLLNSTSRPQLLPSAVQPELTSPTGVSPGILSPTLMPQFRMQHQPMQAPVAMHQQQVAPPGGIRQQQMTPGFQLQLQNPRQSMPNIGRRPSSGKPS